MPFHQAVQDLILWGHRFHLPPTPPQAEPPAELVPVIAIVKEEHQRFNAAAVDAGHRYRSAFWALYLLAALAVLCAVAPVALGWTDHEHPLHRFAVAWGVLELSTMAATWLIYRRGVRNDWQGQWLAQRSRAELVWYLPLAACLRDESTAPGPIGNWYAELFGDDDDDDAVRALCMRMEPQARAALVGAWACDTFVRQLGSWTRAILAGQRHYHQRIAARHSALQHRVHRITAALFGLCALGAAAHLFWHADLLLIATTVFPALGAALHGALVQSESHRLVDTARQLDSRLALLDAEIATAISQDDPGSRAQGVHRAAFTALNLILEEHQEWHHLVRPHHLPLG